MSRRRGAGGEVLAGETGDRREGLFALRYALSGRLGQGGVADVYRAEDRLTGATVALKLARQGAPDSAWRERLVLHEGRVAAALRHPSLVRLLARGRAQGRPYLAFEHLPGGSLAEQLRQSSLDLAGLVRCLVCV